jgi:hypothetical protein
MPTVLRVEGFRFYFFSNESGEPAHVHVRRGGGFAKLWLHPVEIAAWSGLTSPELRKVRELTFEHQAFLVGKWNEYFSH